jgi:AraC family transcriptional activator of pobA
VVGLSLLFRIAFGTGIDECYLKYANMNTNTHLPSVRQRKISPLPDITISAIDSETKELLLSFGERQGYEIICIASGSGAYCIDLQHGHIGNNQVFVIRPGQKRRIVLDRCEEGYLFSFSPTLFQTGELELDMAGQGQLLQLFSESGQIILCDEMLEDLRKVANMLLKEFSRLHLFQDELLKRYLKIFLIYLARQITQCVRPIQRTREMELVQQFLRLINQHYRTKKMVAEYANELLISPNYLIEIVRKNTGYAAGFHIRQRIALEAKRMALYSDTSMKEIAYALGYSDPCHFSKFFNTATGVNFSTFKKENKLSFTQPHD